MKHDYSDITSRITEESTWHDMNGVPRYGEFTPDQCPNIYSKLVALMRIACQSCGRQFDVEMHADPPFWGDRKCSPREWHYGDPPAHHCVGDTMNCEDLAVLQAWKKEPPLFEWRRLCGLEGQIGGDIGDRTTIRRNPDL